MALDLGSRYLLMPDHGQVIHLNFEICDTGLISDH